MAFTFKHAPKHWSIRANAYRNRFPLLFLGDIFLQKEKALDQLTQQKAHNLILAFNLFELYNNVPPSLSDTVCVGAG